MASEDELNRYIDAIGDVFSHTIELARTLSEEQGELPTACPGWNVKDNIAHMVGLEQVLSGSPHPDIELPELSHVKTDIDRYMEQQIHIRRQLPLAAITDEFVGLAPRRIAQLTSAAAQGDIEVAGILGGLRRLSASLPIRAFDLWAHEQDVRRALELEPRMDCPAGHVALERTLGAWQAVLPKKAATGGVLHIDVVDHQRTSIDLGEDASEVTMTMTADVATRLGCGRGRVEDLLADILITGDQAMVNAVTPHLAFTP